MMRTAVLPPPDSASCCCCSSGSLRLTTSFCAEPAPDAITIATIFAAGAAGGSARVRAGASWRPGWLGHQNEQKQQPKGPASRGRSDVLAAAAAYTMTRGSARIISVPAARRTPCDSLRRRPAAFRLKPSTARPGAAAGGQQPKTCRKTRKRYNPACILCSDAVCTVIGCLRN